MCGFCNVWVCVSVGFVMCVGACMCGCVYVFCNVLVCVWVLECVGVCICVVVLVICLHVFTVFCIVSFMYSYSYLFCLY